MGFTKKPCPGCGEVFPRRKANEVCHQCRERLDNHDRMVELVEKDEKTVVLWYSLSGMCNWLSAKTPYDVRERLAQAFDHLVGAFCEKMPKGAHSRFARDDSVNGGFLFPHRDGKDDYVDFYEKGYSYPADPRRVPVQFPKVLAELLEASLEAAETAYRHGFQNGAHEVANDLRRASKSLSRFRGALQRYRVPARGVSKQLREAAQA